MKKTILALCALLSVSCGGGTQSLEGFSEPPAVVEETANLEPALLLRGGGTGEDQGRVVATDQAGNLFVAGSFSGQADFGISSPGGQSGFLVRYDSQGNLVWAQPIGHEITALRLDSLGNPVVGGRDGQGAFVAGFDADGNLLGTVPLETSNPVTDLAIGPQNEIYASTLDRVVQLDPPEPGFWVLLGWVRRDIGGQALAVSGDRLLVSQPDGLVAIDFPFTVILPLVGPLGARDIAGDANGGAYVSGDDFLAHVDSEGNELWRVPSPGGQVESDADGHVFVAGSHLAHYDGNGQLLWDQPLGAAANGIALTRGSNPTLVGSFSGQIDLDPSEAVRTVESAGGQDLFVAQFSPEGKLTSAGVRPLPFVAPGVTYNGLHKVDNPSPATVTSELGVIKKHFATLRTYYPQYGGGQVDLGKLTKAAGLNVFLGLFLFPGHNDWTEADYKNFVKTAVPRGNVTALIIGNEDPQDLDLILSYVDKAHADFAKLPVSSAQTTTFWLTDSRAKKLADKVDFIAVNIYPGWDGVPWKEIDRQPVLGGKKATGKDSFASFKTIYEQVQKKFPGMNVVVTETGWPTNYGRPGTAARPSSAVPNAKEYLELVRGWANQNKKTVLIHNMYNDDNGVDAASLFNFHFGLIDSSGNSKGILF